MKTSLAVTHKRGLIVGARTFPGNPYDGHTLAAQLEQTTTLLQDLAVKPAKAVVDLGYRGVDHLVPATVIHRGRSKTMTGQQRRWLKRRQAIEPVIGHLKADHGMRRCWLKGSDGDARNAVLCAAGFNIHWLLRAIVRLGLRAVFLAWIEWASYARRLTVATKGPLRRCLNVWHRTMRWFAPGWSSRALDELRSDYWNWSGTVPPLELESARI